MTFGERKVAGLLHLGGLVGSVEVILGCLVCAEVGQGVKLGNLDMSAPEFPTQAPRGWSPVRLVSPPASTGTLAGKVRQPYYPAPPTPAWPGFEEHASDLDGFQDAGFAWAVATSRAEVNGAARMSRRGSRRPVWCTEKAELSGKLTPAADELVWRVAWVWSMPKVSGFSK